MKFILTLLLLPFSETFTIESKLHLYSFEVDSCDVRPKTIFHEDINKHEIIFNNTKYQLVGTLFELKSWKRDYIVKDNDL